MLTGARTIRRDCACGWTGAYTTTGYAEKAYRAHSCDVDWTPRPCSQAKAHAHGSAAHYKHCGCRCWPCREAVLDQYAASAKARAYGRPRLVDATVARNHVLQLMYAGMGWPRIVEVSGLDGTVLVRLIWGKRRNDRREISQRITRDTEASLLAVSYDPADGGPAVDGASTTRKLRALVALGWWPSLLAREAGYEQAYLDRLLTGRKVRPGTARRVHALYRRLSQASPPTGTYADRARLQAAERGWAPPLRIGGRALVGVPLEDPARRPGPERGAA